MLPPSLIVFSKRESASPIRCAVSKLGKVGAWLERESPQLEKLSHDCEGCLQTVHKLPVNTQEIWKISQPTPFLCFPRKDHYARRADCAETCCRVGNFLHCDQVFLLGPASLGIETSHWKEVCTAPRKSVIWNDIMVRCHIFVRQGFKNPSHGVWSLMRYPPKFNRHQNFDDSSCRPLRPRAKKYCKKEDFCNMK